MSLRQAEMREKGKEELKGIELANSIYNNVDGYKVVLSRSILSQA